MRRYVETILYLVIFPLVVVVGAIWFTFTFQNGEKSNQGNVVIRYLFELSNESNQAVEQSKLQIFSPADLGRSQRLVSLQSDPQFSSVNEGELGNVMDFQFGLIPPFGRQQIVITAELDLPNSPVAESIGDRGRYLSDSEYLSLKDPRIQKVAQQLKGQVTADVAKEIYDWAGNHIRYVGYIREDRGALYAVTYGQGDCTEYMYAMVAMLRVKGIPARGMAGFYLDRPQQVVKAEQYHNWAEYYDGSSWRILDPLNKNLDAGYGNYVRFREISMEGKRERFDSQRFVSYDKRLAISMN